MPSDSSLSANRSCVTFTGSVTVTGPASAACGTVTSASAASAGTTENIAKTRVRDTIGSFRAGQTKAVHTRHGGAGTATPPTHPRPDHRAGHEVQQARPVLLENTVS